MNYCDICDSPHGVNPRTGLCAYCATSSRNGEKIVAGAVVGGIVAGPIGVIAGGLLGSILGEKD